MVLMNYILAFVAGFFVKWVDWIEDDRKGEGTIKFPLAIFYGGIIGYLISVASFSEIFLGALLAQVFARKIDNISHVIGFLTSILALFYFGFPAVQLNYLLYFMLLAFLDEQDFIGRFRFLTEYRLFLKIGAVLMLFIGRWDYAIAILLFDLGYVVFTEIRKRFIK